MPWTEEQQARYDAALAQYDSGEREHHAVRPSEAAPPGPWNRHIPNGARTRNERLHDVIDPLTERAMRTARHVQASRVYLTRLDAEGNPTGERTEVGAGDVTISPSEDEAVDWPGAVERWQRAYTAPTIDWSAVRRRTESAGAQFTEAMRNFTLSTTSLSTTLNDERFRRLGQVRNSEGTHG